MFKNTHIWIGSYIKQELKRALAKREVRKPIHIMFSCMDHYEPDWGGADEHLQRQRVERWVNEYPALAQKHKDADGRHPKHTFFYPAECYTKEHLDMLKQICDQGFGEVEVHLHHDGDTEETLKQKLKKAKEDFSSHGFLGKRALSEQIYFGFIHGNWSLNNSRPDGKWCGVKNETHVLAQMGCYADFTYPSAPSATQPKKINSIYYNKSSADKPKSHNKGAEAQVGKFTKHDLLLVQGPLTLNWKRRSKGIFPRIENGDLTGNNPPTQDRVDLWVQQHICVKGKEDWIFIKVHTHGAPEKNAGILLGEPMDQMYSYLEEKYNNGTDYALHYVSAREMYNIIKAAEAGEQGEQNEYRDYMIERNR